MFHLRGCFLSRIYIKPQLPARDVLLVDRCFLSRIYIKPQRIYMGLIGSASCFLSRIYIKPQRVAVGQIKIIVVSYLVSTSNHNRCFLSRIYIKPQRGGLRYNRAGVVSYLVSTSNHNSIEVYIGTKKLFLISYLHQTTTCPARLIVCCKLFLISYLHQTTTPGPILFKVFRCFLSRIYIKPQQKNGEHYALVVVSYLVSTSNHNLYHIITYISKL